MSRTAWFDAPLPRILAHRGLALEHPQNSVGAFRAALDAGATHLETDVRVTADGVAVLVHDPSIAELQVATTTLAGLRRIAPAVATLADALDALPAARFNIDVKAAAAAPAVAEVLRARPDTVDRVLVTSFSRRRRRAVTRRLPPVAASAGMLDALAAVLAARSGSLALLRRTLTGIDALQVPEEAAGIRMTAPAVIDRLHRIGVELHIWTVNDPDRMRRLVSLGVDGVVTDRADLAVRALS